MAKTLQFNLIICSFFFFQVFTAKIELTTFHGGYFEFRLCPVGYMQPEATQECLNKHLLTVNGKWKTKYVSSFDLFHTD